MSTESFESVYERLYQQLHNPCGLWKAATIAEWFDDLERAHDREIAQARDPQRLRGTKPDTFDGAIEALREFRWQHATNDDDAIPYINGVAKAHAQSLKREYDRGYHDGEHSMDAEHRAIAMRLRALPLDGGSHENLSQIVRAIWHSDFGWTKGACAALRDELVRLMGGVSDGTAEPITTDEFIKYVEEDTRRLKGDASKAGDGDDTCDSQCRGACAADRGRDSGEQEVTDGGVADDCGADSRCGGRGGDLHLAGVTYDTLGNERRKAIAKLRYLRERGANIWNREIVVAIGLGIQATNDDMCDHLIHLLGGDQPSGIDVLRDMDEREIEGGITDELRKFAMTYKNVWYDDSESIIYTTSDFPPTEDAMSMMNHINEIADRIDVRFNWAMISRSSELGLCKLRINQLESERDELQAKLDEYDSTHVELPRDKDGCVFVIDGGAQVGDLALTVRQMTLTKEGWKIRAYDESYEVEREPSFFEVCDAKPDPIEETIEKLTLGEITQTEAIERIKSLGQE